MYLFKRLPYLTILFFFLLSIAKVNADQDQPFDSDVGCFTKKYLSLHDAIVLALRNNPQIRSAELQRIVDRFSLEVARNQFFPQYSFDASATYSNGTKPYYTANPKTTLETPWGTTIGLGLADQVNPGRETSAVLEITQPLLRGFGPQVTRANYKNALDQEIINCLDFKNTIITTITSIIQAYYKLTQDYNTIEVDQLSLNEALKLLHATELRIKAGKLAPTEVVQQQAQIANQKLALTRDRNTLSQDYRDLLIKLGLDPRSNLEIDKRIQTQQLFLPTAAQAIETALANNIDYQKSLIKLKQLERAYLVAKNEQQWKLDLIGRTQQEIIRNKNFAPVGINQVEAIGNDQPGNDRTLIINLNIPINDVKRKQGLVQARIAIQQFKIALATQRQELIAAVLNGVQNLQTQSLQLKLALDAVGYSKQSLYIAKKKFQYGRTTMFEITSLQKNLTVQQLALITQKIAYLNGEAEFEKLLGISLEKWCIKIEQRRC